MNILFAENSKQGVVELKPETVKDLALDEIVESIARGENEKKIIGDIFRKLPIDCEDIRYRQEILKDLMENEMLAEELSEVLGMIRTLKEYSLMKPVMMQQDHSLYLLLEKLRELSVFVNVSEDMVKCLGKYTLQSAGLCSIYEQLERNVHDEQFAQAKKDILQMLEALSTVKGAMVGVNFTEDLNIEQVTTVEFLPYRIRSKYKLAEVAASMHNVMNRGDTANPVGSTRFNTRVIDPLLVAMTPHIEKHLKRHFTKIRNVMAKYVKLDSAFITEMYEGLTFYLALVRFGRRLHKEGHEICMPVLTDDTGSFRTQQGWKNHY